MSLTTPSPGKTNKLENIKNWTISTYKCSRQSLYEKLGKTNRTVDSELEGQIESLRDTQRKYGNILRLARALTSHFYHVVQTQVINRGEWWWLVTKQNYIRNSCKSWKQNVQN